MLTAAQLAPLNLAQPIKTITCQVAYPVVCIDQAGFAVMMRVLDPIEYLTYADQTSNQAIRAMLDDGLLPIRLSPCIRG